LIPTIDRIPMLTNTSALDLIHANRWSRLFFTTYALSLSFFESVILDAIVRNDIPRCTILSDISGVRAAMEEYGAQSAGRVYQIEPVAVNHGCFHPKLLTLTSAGDSHLIVGSGNLTFGGWGANLECVEHLHPSFAADAFTDAAEFLLKLSDAPNVQHSSHQECAEAAADLKRSVAGARQNGNIWLLHSLEVSILEQVYQLTRELGGARRLVIASPFFDELGVERLCARLGLDHAYVHVHDGGSVSGSAALNWPGGAPGGVKPIFLNVLKETEPRLLHAKIFEILCGAGRLVLSGSANATLAALEIGRNVELCVARIERSASVGWRFNDALAPFKGTLDTAEETLMHEESVVLSATLLGDELKGVVLGKFPDGDALAYRREGAGWVMLGKTEVVAGGAFTLQAANLRHSIFIGQFILRLEQGEGRLAQGFVALPEAREIARRLGSAAPNFFGFLQRNDTPEDIAAIMAYFYEHQDALPKRLFSSSGQGGATVHEDLIVDVKDLLDPGTSRPGRGHGAGGGVQAWVAFMQRVFAGFSESRGPFETTVVDADDGDERAETGKDAREREAANRNSWMSFEKLLDRMLAAPPTERDTAFALHLTQYVCDRLSLDPFRVRSYLNRLVESFNESVVASDDIDVFKAAVLIWGTKLDIGVDGAIERTVRKVLLHAGCTVDGPVPDLSKVGGLMRRLALGAEPSVLWERLCLVRTPQEEVRSFASSPHIGTESSYPSLCLTPQWEALALGMNARIILMTKLLDYCPHCYRFLSSVEAHQLRNAAVTSHPCGRILICSEV
jgi:hypothetical protein